jgi:hypothetical protein
MQNDRGVESLPHPLHDLHTPLSQCAASTLCFFGVLSSCTGFHNPPNSPQSRWLLSLSSPLCSSDRPQQCRNSSLSSKRKATEANTVITAHTSRVLLLPPLSRVFESPASSPEDPPSWIKSLPSHKSSFTPKLSVLLLSIHWQSALRQFYRHRTSRSPQFHRRDNPILYTASLLRCGMTQYRFDSVTNTWYEAVFSPFLCPLQRTGDESAIGISIHRDTSWKPAFRRAV